MKTKGIVRRLDDLGRIVLPIEMRRSFDLAEHDRVEICAQDDTIILRKYEPNCIFCGGDDRITMFKGKPLCQGCLDKLQNL